MSARLVFSIAAIVNFVGGLGVLFVPDSFLSPFGLTLDAAGVHMARVNGSLQQQVRSLDWVNVALDALFALRFGYVAFIRRAA